MFSNFRFLSASSQVSGLPPSKYGVLARSPVLSSRPISHPSSIRRISTSPFAETSSPRSSPYFAVRLFSRLAAFASPEVVQALFPFIARTPLSFSAHLSVHVMKYRWVSPISPTTCLFSRPDFSTPRSRVLELNRSHHFSCHSREESEFVSTCRAHIGGVHHHRSDGSRCRRCFCYSHYHRHHRYRCYFLTCCTIPSTSPTTFLLSR